MKNAKIAVICLMSFVFVQSCTDKQQTSGNSETALENVTSQDNSKVSVDWQGTYEAILPCADCSGIRTVLKLTKDNTYSLDQVYLDKSIENKEEGTFEWDASGSIITLKLKDGQAKYLVGENQVISLDMEGKEINGPTKESFILNKKRDL